MLQGGHKEFSKYPRNELKKIFTHNGYHSPNMEMTDNEDDEDDTTKLFTQKYWWQSEKVFIL